MNEWIFIGSLLLESFQVFFFTFNHRIANWSLIFLSEFCLFSVATLYHFFYMNFSLIWTKLNDGITNCFLQTSYNKVIIIAVLDEMPDTKHLDANFKSFESMYSHIFLVSFLKIQWYTSTVCPFVGCVCDSYVPLSSPYHIFLSRDNAARIWTRIRTFVCSGGK